MEPTAEDILYEELVLTREELPTYYQSKKTAFYNFPYGGYGGNQSWIRYRGHDWLVSDIGFCYRNHLGQYHRKYGPAVRIPKYDITEWYLNGKLHCEFGPARIHKNSMFWYRHGNLHREDGPAVIEYGGPKQYWLDGIKYKPKEYKREIARRIRRGIIKVENKNAYTSYHS